VLFEGFDKYALATIQDSSIEVSSAGELGDAPVRCGEPAQEGHPTRGMTDLSATPFTLRNVSAETLCEAAHKPLPYATKSRHAA